MLPNLKPITRVGGRVQKHLILNELVWALFAVLVSVWVIVGLAFLVFRVMA